MNKTIAITGANRGIGLEFVKQFAVQGDKVIACYRNDCTELQKLTTQHTNISMHKLDVTNKNDINQFAREINQVNIDILINNAGIYGTKQDLDSVTPEVMLEVFRVNVTGPLELSKALLPAIKQSSLKNLVFITSKMGSITDNSSGRSYAYRASKAALNAVVKSLSMDLHEIKTLLLHPGWVRTDMGGPNAAISTEQSVKGMIKQIYAMQDKLQFVDYAGEVIPW